jgi:hypothetical protein
MSTLLQLVNEVLRRTGQVEISTLSNAQTPAVQVRDFINDTYFEMLQKLKSQRFLKQATVTTINGTASYNLASDAEINALLGDSVIETGNGQALRETDYTYPLTHGTNATGKPNCFYRAGNQIVLYPTPDATYTVQYSYLIKPANLNADSDTPQLPAEWEKVLILGAQARLEKFLGEPESAEQSYMLYLDNMGHLRKRGSLKPEARIKGSYRGGR